jgi:hypothetical protein
MNKRQSTLHIHQGGRCLVMAVRTSAGARACAYALRENIYVWYTAVHECNLHGCHCTIARIRHDDYIVRPDHSYIHASLEM